MQDFERRIVAIEARNIRVEKDKTWETSRFRKIVIAVLIYLVVLSFFIAIGKDRPFISAFVPVIGFLLSALALDGTRKIWENRKGEA